MRLCAGDILLTAGIGGPSAKWKDRWISKAIIYEQRLQMVGWIPNYSHAELLTNERGRTFAARWRTRQRDNGLSDYIGSKVLIGHPVDPNFNFNTRWILSNMNRFNGRIYPVVRILLAGLTANILPAWVRKASLFNKWAMCSEVVACLYTANPCYAFCQTGFKGIFPGNLEDRIKNDDAFEISFEGILTEQLMKDWNLPTYR